MPSNSNPWVAELLSWHGHDRGGVRVPFHANMGKPLGFVVDTSLIRKLKRLALDLLDGTPDTPRYIFLVGGPGNGKSEAVEVFLRELDTLANSQGELINTVAQKFSLDPISPRRVEITSSELQETILQERIRRLIIIQDASAVDGPDLIAEDPLIEDLVDLITCPAEEEPVFICCANRGLVARARTAIQTKESFDWFRDPEITELLTELLTATGLGPSALAVDRPQCWPLERDRRFAAWPLDLDSIIKTDTEMAPFEQMIANAADERKWQGFNSCSDCTSRELCPFYINAEMLRDEDTRQRLITLLRHSEMATGQRWNFRDAFSLCAELIVGQRDDFNLNNGSGSPCFWVHERVCEISLNDQPLRRMPAVWDLVFHLYSQSLFPEWSDPSEELHANTLRQSTLTQAALEVFIQRQRSRGTQVRHLLAGVFSRRLDPAHATPSNAGSILRLVEEEFGQSVRQGLETFRDKLNPPMEQLLELMSLAEANWSEAVRESSRVRAILESLRIISSMATKRFIGVREGEYLNRENLVAFEALHRDPQKLREVVPPMRSFLAPEGTFGGSLVRVFGQPSPEPAGDILVTYPLGNVVPKVASESTDERPSHDIPWVEVEGYHIPLTFELFVALQAHSSGAQIASFAPHTRAAIDKVRNAIAGRLARDTEGMIGGGVSIKVGTLGYLTLGANGVLEFKESE